MKKPFGKVVTVAVLMAFLLSSFLVAGGLNKAEAQESDSSELSAASGSNRFVVWQDGDSVNSDILFRRSTDNGATWKAVVNLSNNPGNSLDPQLAVSGSNVYIIWRQFSADGTLADVFFRGSTNNGATWGSKIKISSSGTNFSSSIDVTSSGSNVYITWQDNGASDVFFRRSIDSGATWKSIDNLSNNADQSSDPHVAVSGSNVYVVWVKQISSDGSEVYFRRSADNGDTWEPRKKLSNSGTDFSVFTPDIAASGSNVYVTWADDKTSDVLFRRSIDNGASWKAIINISKTTNISSENPQVAVSGSNVFIVWSDRAPGNDDIMLKRSTNSGSTLKAVKNLSNSAGNSEVPQVGA